ncbi:amidohydrolase [Capillimicrobium parvum]|uniref:N-substituted formamide deformylase n=1 Tax=Capillimicrobium parvum TaxID=2884022 RepID=A0A9E6XSI9_9ACTN|nr:amidohydrolase [Capillimicrobium parvum]UGS33872.1 N-substituted formamide deformylase [Capillimicrobium parvum]
MTAVTADVVVRAGAIHAFDGSDRRARSLAIRGTEILAMGDRPDDLDELIGARTRVVHDPELVLLPAFHDTHMHQMWTAVDAHGVALGHTRCIADVVGAVAVRARETPPGEWIVSSASWHETTLAENRMPTAQEIDAATREHPVVLRRGGHNLVANSMALARAGIDRDTPNPERGTIVRGSDGSPTGWLIEPLAMKPVLDLLPPFSFEDRVDALGKLCRELNAHGIAAVRDAGSDPGAPQVFQALHDRGGLTTRSRMMIMLTLTGDTEAKIAEIESWPVHTGFGDDMLRIDALKLLLDGGVEAAAMDEPYANDPDFRGHLLIEPDEIEQLVTVGLDRGWKVGAHAFGDFTTRTLVDVYERVLRTRPDLPPGTLVIEHAGLAGPDVRRRAIELGIGISVQYPVLYRLAANAVRYWGPERADRIFPIREWIEEGAVVGGGSDAFVADWDVLAGVRGMVTRETAVAGVQGARSAIDRRTAFELYTNRAAEFVGEGDRRGSLVPGQLADIVAFREDPLTCELDALTELDVALTLVGGRAVHDPGGAFA